MYTAGSIIDTILFFYPMYDKWKLLYRDRRSTNLFLFAWYIISSTSSSNFPTNCITSDAVKVPGHELHPHCESKFNGSLGKIKSLSWGHFKVPRCVPNSVGSAHRLQWQEKYFVSKRWALRALVDQSACVYIVLKWSHLYVIKESF